MSAGATIRPATSAEDFEIARRLVEEYGASLGVDLSFQDFAREISTFPGEYVPPAGALLVGEIDGAIAGCVAVRPFEPPTIAELKRLYVRPSRRGHGLGRALTESALESARRAGYRRVRLDTLPGMEAARQIYRDMGFREIAAYRHNPITGTTFLEYHL